MTHLDMAKSDAANNSFTLDLQLGARDFVSLDEGELVQPRQANGDLPAIRFMHPAAGSLRTDKGVDVGLPFRGAAPDLGAFEE